MRQSRNQWRKAPFTESRQGIQWMKALVRTSTGKAIQWRGFGHSVNRWIWKIEIFCAHPLPKSQLQLGSFRTSGTAMRKILGRPGVLPCLVPWWPKIVQIRISFRSRSNVSFWMLTTPWIFYPISFCSRAFRFVVFQTKVAHLLNGSRNANAKRRVFWTQAT